MVHFIRVNLFVYVMFRILQTRAETKYDGSLRVFPFAVTKSNESVDRHLYLRNGAIA
jgi:hypothetical protein